MPSPIVTNSRSSLQGIQLKFKDIHLGLSLSGLVNVGNYDLQSSEL